MQGKTGKPILVTGGAPFGGRAKADAMAETLQRYFHTKEIWIEEQSKHTAENASYTAVLLKEHENKNHHHQPSLASAAGNQTL